MEFYLMNKDKIVFKFRVDRTPIGVNYNIIGEVQGKLPLNLKDISVWLKSRYILSHRLDIDQFFKRLGIENIEDYLDITNCISVTDSYWVKSINSKKSWSSVSPFRNSLNKAIAEFSFTGKINGKYIAGSPDFSTGGNFPKCWKKNDGRLYLYKAGSTGAFNAGLEPFSEVFAYQLGSFLGLDVVQYRKGFYKGTNVSVCESMCTEDIGLVSLSDILNDNYVDFKRLSELYIKYGNKVEYQKFVNMIVLDCLICNIDRHYGNISYFIDNNSQTLKGMSMLYDNNLSCIPYYVTSDDLICYIDNTRARDGRTFNELYNIVKCNYTKNILLKAKDFRFKGIGIPKADKRVPILNKMLQYRVSECLKLHQ